MSFDGPISVMNLLMAVVAHQHEVVGLGGTAILPFHNVVRHAPFRCLGTTDAALVAGFE